MAIVLNCDCGKKLQVGDDMVGRRVKCPGCGTILAIAAPAALAPAAAPAQIRCTCKCGKTLQVRAEHAGRSVRCPACQAVLTVPGPAAPVPTATRAAQPVPPPPPRLAAPEPFPTDEPVRHKAASASRRRLWPWIAAAGVLLLLTTSGLLAWMLFFGKAPLPPDLALVPANAQGFVSLRIGDLWELPDAKMARQMMPPGEAAMLTDFEGKIGLTIADIERATFVSTDGENKEMWIVFALKKPYDGKKIKDQFPPGTQEVKQGNSSYHLIPTGDPKTAIHFFNDRIVVAGSESGVKRCLKQRDEKTLVGPLAEALTLASGKHQIVVAAAPPAELMKKLKTTLPPMMEQFACFLDLQTGTLVIDDTPPSLQLELRLTFATEDKAKEVKSALDGLVGMGKLFLPQLKALLTQGPNAQEGQKLATWLETSLNSVKPEQKGTLVTLNVKLDTSGVSESLKKMFQGAAGNVQQSALKVQNINNLKQLALSMQNYADVNKGQFPPAVIMSQDGKRPLYSWRVEILPYVEEDVLYREFHRDEPWDSPHNSKLLTRMPKIYRLPGAEGPLTVTHYQVFTGPNTPFVGAIAPRIPATFQDGTSNTFLIAEAREPVPWTKPEDLVYDKNRPLPKLGSLEPNGFCAALADGSAHFFEKGRISERTIRLAIDPRDGELMPKDWLAP